MKLEKILNITGTIRLLTGLHIGAGKDSIEIGGLDLPIMKHPHNKAPYIPGSSIKGKMRSLLEVTQVLGLGEKPYINEKGEPCGCAKCLVCDIFGAHKASKDIEATMRPTRLLMRDSLLTPEFMEKHKNGALPMEVKYENTIDRVRGTAENPRPVERVPAGTEFTFNVSLKLYDNDDQDTFIKVLKSGLKLIELDALGGHSSRGSGQVEFCNLTCNGETFDLADVNF